MKKLFLLFLLLANLIPAVAAEPYTIYPVPQEQIDGHTSAGVLTPNVCIVADDGIDEVTVARAKEVLKANGLSTTVAKKAAKGCVNLLLGTVRSKGVADSEAARLRLSRHVFTLEKYDRHIFSIYPGKAGVAQILVLGENTDAVFCGLASLEQILEQCEVQNGKKTLQAVTLYDYADVRDRGIIEGYYGVPYSAEVTKDLFRFMARYKMNTYMYGAKSDPYHSKLWADAYPTSITDDQKRIGYLTQQMMADITAVGRATKVNFIWAIHPGTAFTNPEKPEVLGRIMNKFQEMHRLGVRQFGVFVDDVGVPSDDKLLRLGAERLTQLQKLIDERWNGAAAEPADTVKPLHYVPQLYAYSWVSREQGKRFFNSLSSVPEKVRIYITGRAVWTVPNSFDLDLVNGWLGRKASWWWNYPCNDNDVTKLFPMDTYANFADESHINSLARLEADLKGTQTLIINPMQQGEASKIALFSVADYAWNNSGFNNDRSWDAALEAVVGTDYAASLRTVAPYLRYYDDDALAYEVNNYRRSVSEGKPRPGALIGLLRGVVAACAKLRGLEGSARESDRLLYDDLRPWLLKLEAMASETVARLEGHETTAIDLDNNPDFHFPILTGMGDDISLSVKTAEPSAKYLQPLLMELRKN